MIKMGTIKSYDIDRGNMDSCSYTLAIIRTLFTAFIISIIVLFSTTMLLRAIAEILMWAVVSLQVGYCIEMTDFAAAFLMTLSFFGATFIAFRLTLMCINSVDQRAVYLPFKLYDAYKNKYCKKITFKEE